MNAAPARVEHLATGPRCTVCHGEERTLVCTAEEIESQRLYLQAFHRRRLRARSGDAALTDRADFTQDDESDIVACVRCGLVYRNQRPSEAAVESRYASDTYGTDRLEALFDSQLELFRAKLVELRGAARLPRRFRAIEIGSFVGGFLAAAREAGGEVQGIDPGEEVVDFCRSKGLRVHRTTAEQAPIHWRSADCVAIWNTFDQLPEPGPTLTAAHRWLRLGGVLAVRVPNGSCFRAVMSRLRALPSAWRGPLLAAMAWNNLLAFPYLHGYSLPNLDALVERTGLRRIAVAGDQLTRLADEHTASWAALEERVLKATWRGVARIEPTLAPWLDVYYRKS